MPLVIKPTKNWKEKQWNVPKFNTKPCWILTVSTFLALRKKWPIHLHAGTRHSFYGLLLTLKPYCFNIFCCSICIPDNQTGSWPLGPWRSCRAVPHTHGCSEGNPRGRIQSWIPCCPGCCCPHWGSPHPSVQTLEGPKPGQAVGEVVADHVFPILSMKKMSNNCHLHCISIYPLCTYYLLLKK